MKMLFNSTLPRRYLKSSRTSPLIYIIVEELNNAGSVLAHPVQRKDGGLKLLYKDAFPGRYCATEWVELSAKEDKQLGPMLEKLSKTIGMFK